MDGDKQPHDQFAEDFAYLRALSSRTVDDADELRLILDHIHSSLLQVDFAKYVVASIKPLAGGYIQELFKLRVQLRDKIVDWTQRGLMTGDVQAAIRNVFRSVRYASDILGELALDHKKREGGGTPPLAAFTGQDNNTLIHPKFDVGSSVSFQSGDVLLVRGTQHNSAAIARIGDNDSQFSHVGIIHIAADGKQWVVEALIEEGSTINTLDDALGDGIGRAVLFRHKDPDLAQRAAREIFEFVRQTQSEDGDHIPYDFSMSLDDYDTLFCSKLVRLAFDRASEGRYLLPRYPSSLTMKNRDFLNRIGVVTQSTFAPGDMELEPDFDLVAEWRDYRVTARLRLQDMLISKLFEWMDQYNYRFREDAAIHLIGFLGRLSSHISNRARALLSDALPKVPENMSRRTIAVIAMLHRTAQPLLEQLVGLEDRSIRDRGYQLHPRRVMQELEKIRQQSGNRIGYLVRRPV